MGLWYNDVVPKPNIKVIHIQMTLATLTDSSQDPYGVLRPLSDPVSEVIGHLLFHMEEGGLGVPDGMPVLAEDCTLLRHAIGGRYGQGSIDCLHELGVCGGAFIIPLHGTNGMDGGCLAQWARQPSGDRHWQ